MLSYYFQNNIPVFSPALTDGSLGDMIYFHSFKNPGLVLDIVDGKIIITGTRHDQHTGFSHVMTVVFILDIRKLNSRAVFAKKTGMIILGGGLVKHHIANANLMVTNFLSSCPFISQLETCNFTVFQLLNQMLRL